MRTADLVLHKEYWYVFFNRLVGLKQKATQKEVCREKVVICITVMQNCVQVCSKTRIGMCSRINTAVFSKTSLFFSFFVRIRAYM